MRSMVLGLGLALLLVSPAAHAISRHEIQGKPRAIKNGSGKVVGAEIRILLRSEGLPVVRVGLGRTATSSPLRGDPGQVRALLTSMNPSFVAFQTGEQHGLSATAATEFKLTLHYGKGNDLKAGDEVDVWTAWGNQPGNYVHYFGVFSGTGLTTLRLPGAE